MLSRPEAQAAGGSSYLPCGCSGAPVPDQEPPDQKQAAATKSNPADERAYVCSVCRAPYSLPPPRPLWSARALVGLRGVAVAAACISLLAFGLSSEA